jgi:3-methyladenine DNA glycosylase AlkD
VTADEIVAWLAERKASEHDLAGMARYGIRVECACGVKQPELRGLAKRVGRDHGLAGALWSTGWREARLLAAMIDEPQRVTRTQMDRWAGDFDSWDVCDGVCLDLFRRTPHAWEKARVWPRAKRGFVRRAGLVLIALVAKDDDAGDSHILDLLPQVLVAAHDDRNEVKKGASWALRNVGKRNSELHIAAMQAAAELRRSESRAARWVGSDALRELDSAKVRQRLGEAVR